LVLKEMNTPIEQRLVQIIINMERCRWVPFELKGDYFMINIPEFKLHAYQGNKSLWEMNVVVGKATNKTVIFNGNLQYIVLNPYWVVTSNIFIKEFVPKLRKNAGYLKSQDMELAKATAPELLIDPATVNWNLSESHYHNFVARQKPGINNALGKVKFIFPNQYSIYLHDTPAKALFSESSRSFSHGCIRVEKPEALAKYLLRDDPNWTDSALQRAWEKKTEQYVPLKKKVPVIIAYFTAWVDENGNVNFRNDIYGHDAKMSKLLIEKPKNQIISAASKINKE
jgi:L,D-transpeptidase YcbB